MPDILDLIADFKRQLAERTEQAVLEVTEAYTALLQKFTAELEVIVRQIERLEASGREVSETVLYNQTRLRFLINQIINEIRNYNALVVSVVTEAQAIVAQQAIREADELIRSIFSEVEFDPAFLRFDEIAARNIIARFSNENYIRGILEANAPQMIKDIRDVFVRAIVRGSPARIVARILQRKFEMPVLKAKIVARTEIVSASRDSNLARYRLSETVKAWRWSATLDNRTCAVCIALHGQIFPLETPFATHPQCRCSPVPVVRTFEEMGLDIPEPPRSPGLDVMGEDWFRRQNSDVQMRILGKGKYQLYKSGQIKLSDLIRSYNHPVYGPSREERSLKSLR